MMNSSISELLGYEKVAHIAYNVYILAIDGGGKVTGMKRVNWGGIQNGLTILIREEIYRSLEA